MEFFSVKRNGHLAKVIFYRPPINMMSFAAAGELEQILTKLKDEDLSVIVLMSSLEDYFIAHADTDDIMRMENQEPAIGSPESWDRANQLLANMPQLTIAAVNGQAWGGGMETALACKMIVSSEKGSFRLFEVSKGTVPGAGGTQRLPRKIGTSKALRMILSCEIADGKKAYESGIADVLLPSDHFEEHLDRWLEEFQDKPLHSFLGAVDAVVNGMKMSLEEGLHLEKQISMKLISSAETKALGDKSME